VALKPVLLLLLSPILELPGGGDLAPVETLLHLPFVNQIIELLVGDLPPV